MTELFQAAFSPINLVYTVLLMVVLLYWLTVFIGLLDLSSFDFDVDTDVDVDADIDVDVDADVDVDTDVDADAGAGGANPVLAFLAFFNLGKVPFMIFLSFLSLFLWMGSVLGNHYIGGDATTFAWILSVPNLFVGLFLTKLITTPLRPLFKDEKNEFESNQDIIGKIGTAVLAVDDQGISQVRVPTQNGSPLVLRVKATEGNLIASGEQALLLHYDEEGEFFWVEPFK